MAKFTNFISIQGYSLCHIEASLMNLDVVLLFNVHGKHLRLCRDGQLT